jgi:thiol-disulfide isomerase/thioredoxin
MPKYNYVTIGLVAAVAVLGGVVVYLYFYRKGSKNSYTPPVQEVKVTPPPTTQPSPSSKKGDLVLFYADWCPHCHHMMNDWLRSKQLLDQDSKMNVISIESKDPELSKHSVPGFPCIRFFPSGLSNVENFVEYKGPRTTESIVDFATKM